MKEAKQRYWPRLTGTHCDDLPNRLLFRPGGGGGVVGTGATKIYFTSGFAAIGGMGWGFGKGLRAEIALGYRNNSLRAAGRPFFAAPNRHMGGAEQRLGPTMNPRYAVHCVRPG